MAPSIFAVSNSSNTANSVFCRSMVSASSRLRKVEIGGSSSRKPAVVVGERQPGRVLEGLKRAALDLAAVEQEIELPQRGPAIDGFEIVVGAEQALSARLALAAGDRAQRVEAARDGGEEALLRLDVGGDRTEQRRLRLVGAVRAAEALDGGVGLPARFEQIMDAETAVLRAEIGVVGPAGAAGVREDEDALLVVHEGLRFGEIGGTGAVLDRETVEPPTACARCGASGR